MSAAPATELDGSVNLTCATFEVVACRAAPGCVEGSAKRFDLPEFMVLDFENKVVRASDFSGYKEVSPIKNQEETGTQLILQGVENGHPWSIAVDRRNGNMITTVISEDLGFTLFGACTTPL
jgi:hypothetical protein